MWTVTVRKVASNSCWLMYNSSLFFLYIICFSKRKRSQGSTYSKMSQETLDKFSKKFGKNEEPDKTKLTMMDLIFYNPKSNPMPQ